MSLPQCFFLFVLFALQKERARGQKCNLLKLRQSQTSPMSNSIQRDKKKRVLFLKHELQRAELTSLVHDFTLSKDVRYKTLQQLNKLPRNSSRTRITNRCVLTGRGHSVYRFCGLSRIKFRELAAQGLLMGVTKASW